MELYLIRHLETELNRKGILQGNKDIPILEQSIETLHKIKKNQQEILNLLSFDVILVSELQRTQMTAIHYGYASDFRVEKLLNELNFGCYEGQKKQQLIADKGELWFNHPQQLILGEPLSQLAERVLEFIHCYQDKQRVLVFGHGSWIRAICSIVRYGNIDKMNQLSIANNELIQLNI